MPRNVAALATPPKAQPPEFRTLTVEEARHLGRVALGSRWAPMLMLALTTGLRQGELLGLKWGDIDGTAGVLQVRRQYERDGAFSTPKASSQRRTAGSCMRRPSIWRERSWAPGAARRSWPRTVQRQIMACVTSGWN